MAGWPVREGEGEGVRGECEGRRWKKERRWPAGWLESVRSRFSSDTFFGGGSFWEGAPSRFTGWLRSLSACFWDGSGVNGSFSAVMAAATAPCKMRGSEKQTLVAKEAC